MQALNITPEQFSRLLRDHNLTREQFIALYRLRPLVYTPELPGRAKLALVLTGVLIFALALFGNALVFYVVTRSKAMRTVTNIFICSLALSDLLITFFCIPVTMLQNISDNWLGVRKPGEKNLVITEKGAEISGDGCDSPHHCSGPFPSLSPMYVSMPQGGSAGRESEAAKKTYIQVNTGGEVLRKSKPKLKISFPHSPSLHPHFPVACRQLLVPMNIKQI
ncbi:pyroglutamylated RF-amide peptide receptor isoform X3 [Macaca fascicularis]|uniref:pyroglutamylated RF-amide peptide receptor isoform X3 n=1 Tax=Macaca fascicularis TaxID=9541 RepID=UPI003D155B77